MTLSFSLAVRVDIASAAFGLLEVTHRDQSHARFNGCATGFGGQVKPGTTEIELTVLANISPAPVRANDALGIGCGDALGREANEIIFAQLRRGVLRAVGILRTEVPDKCLRPEPRRCFGCGQKH